MKSVVLFCTLIGFVPMQAPTGTIAGVIRDPSGAAVPAAQVRAVSVATGLARIGISSELGNYSFPALPAGDYEVSAEVLRRRLDHPQPDRWPAA
jgi:hypothetical protein